MPKTNIGDVELYYEEHGSGDPLLLIMGLGADLQRLDVPDAGGVQPHGARLLARRLCLGSLLKPPMNADRRR